MSIFLVGIGALGGLLVAFLVITFVIEPAIDWILDRTETKEDSK